MSSADERFMNVTPDTQDDDDRQTKLQTERRQGKRTERSETEAEKI
jgi:hypothetical protein